jgi:hypothetical protein
MTFASTNDLPGSPEDPFTPWPASIEVARHAKGTTVATILLDTM